MPELRDLFWKILIILGLLGIEILFAIFLKFFRNYSPMRSLYCYVMHFFFFQPHNSLYLRRLAEIRYTQGGSENIELAKSYFEQAVRTNPSCSRSLYGIILVSPIKFPAR